MEKPTLWHLVAESAVLGVASGTLEIGVSILGVGMCSILR